jgi:hypothetical protein
MGILKGATHSSTDQRCFLRLECKHLPTAFFGSCMFLSTDTFTYIKGKAVPLQAWIGPEGSRKLRSPNYMTTAQDGGKVVSLTHRPTLPPGNAPGTHFC